MSRFYVRPDSVKEGRIAIDGDEAHHILDVMRLKKGDQVIAFDGTGSEYTGIIKETGKKSLVVTITETRNRARDGGYSITLAQSIPKKNTMEYIVQKATELGVDAIIPVVTQRTIVKPKSERAGSKARRWDEIALGAAKQCGRTTMPVIEKSITFDDLMKRVQEFDLVLMPSVENVDRRHLREAISGFKGKSILVLIGPEGGFDKSEIELAAEKKVIFVTLGENTLRCDTAAIAAIAMINCALR